MVSDRKQQYADNVSVTLTVASEHLSLYLGSIFDKILCDTILHRPKGKHYKTPEIDSVQKRLFFITAILNVCTKDVFAE